MKTFNIINSLKLFTVCHLMCLLSVYTANIDSDDYYERLGLPRNATQKQIKKAYNRLSKIEHPDRHPNLQGASKERQKARFDRLETAYKALVNPEKRQEYDITGRVTTEREKEKKERVQKLSDLLEEYKQYPDWVHPTTQRPFLFHLYEDEYPCLVNLFSFIMKTGILSPEIAHTYEDRFCAVSEGINNSYQGDTLAFRCLKDQNLNMFSQIINLHSRFMIGPGDSPYDPKLYLIYLDLSQQDQDGKTVIDHLKEFSADSFGSNGLPSTQTPEQVRDELIKNIENNIISEGLDDQILIGIRKFCQRMGMDYYQQRDIERQARRIMKTKDTSEINESSHTSSSLNKNFLSILGIGLVCISILYCLQRKNSRTTERDKNDDATNKNFWHTSSD